MTNSTTTAASDWEKYGIPPRQPSMAIWSHLFGKDKLPAPPNSDVQVVPPLLGPMDKNGTSTRMLLHDTQAHLERFTVSTDKLLSGVEETKRQITTANDLFQRERETLRDDLVDLGGFLTGSKCLTPYIHSTGRPLAGFFSQSISNRVTEGYRQPGPNIGAGATDQRCRPTVRSTGQTRRRHSSGICLCPSTLLMSLGSS